MSAQCKSCQHASNAPLAGGLQCRRHPPTVVPVMRQGVGGAELSFISVWPVVQLDWVCGDHAPQLAVVVRQV